MSTFEELATSVLAGLEKKLEELENSVRSDEQIREIAREVSSDEWRLRKRVVYAFVSGFTAFALIGLWKPEFYFQPMLDYVYPVKDHFPKFKPEIQRLGLEELPQVGSGIPPKVWDTMRTGQRSQFNDIFERSAFYDALFDRFRSDLVVEFGTPDNHVRVNAANVEKYGAVELRAVARVVAAEYDNQGTVCGRTFHHDQDEIIIVIPQAAATTDYLWFGCSVDYPETTSLRVEGHGMSLDGVALVGVERRDVEQLEVKLSRRAAEKLGLPGASKYDTRTTVSISVSAARD